MGRALTCASSSSAERERKQAGVPNAAPALALVAPSAPLSAAAAGDAVAHDSSPSCNADSKLPALHSSCTHSERSKHAVVWNRDAYSQACICRGLLCVIQYLNNAESDWTRLSDYDPCLTFFSEHTTLSMQKIGLVRIQARLLHLSQH